MAAENPMKKTLIVALAAAALGLTSSALAQTAGPAGLPPQVPVAPKAGHVSRAEMEKVNEEILSKLNLTEDQKTKIIAHRKDMEAKLLELRKANKGTKGAGQSEEVKAKVKEIRKENQEFMKQTLTKPQMKELARLRREEMQKLRAGQTPAATGKP